MTEENINHKSQNKNNVLAESLKLNQESYKMLKDIKRYIFWKKIWTGVKILIVLVPVLLGIFYLPPIIKHWVDKYHYLFSLSNFNSCQISDSNIENLNKEDIREIKRGLSPKQRQMIIEIMEKK